MKTNKERIVLELLDRNFIVKTITSCFDVVARKDNKLILVKVIEDANSLPKQTLQEMERISSALHASSFIVCEKAGARLRDNVVYFRHNMHTINLPTFMTLLNKTPLYMASKKAGITARITGEKLREYRENENMSLGALSRIIGVSKRMLTRYESENAEISLQRARKMYGIFGSSIFREIDLLSARENTQPNPNSDVATKYDNLGFMVHETRKVPFDLVSEKESVTILTRIGDKIHKDLTDLSMIIGASDLAIFSKKKPANIPAITKEEFLEFKKAKELIKFIQEEQEGLS